MIEDEEETGTKEHVIKVDHYVQADIFHCVIAVLVNDALRFLQIFFFRLRRPPVH